MKYQLVKLNGFQKETSAVNGFPPIRETSEDQEIASPDGYTYVPLNETVPVFNPNEEKIVEQVTTEGVYYSVLPLSEDELLEVRKLKIPVNVSRHKLKIALIREGVDIEAIDNIINSFPESLAKKEAIIAWKEAPFIRRDHPLLASIASMLNLSSNTIDELFILAETI